MSLAGRLLLLTGGFVAAVGCVPPDQPASMDEREDTEDVEPIFSLTCNATLRGEQTTTAQLFDTYSCSSFTLSGTEWIQALDVPATGRVVVTASNGSSYPFVLLLDGTGGVIDPSAYPRTRAGAAGSTRPRSARWHRRGPERRVRRVLAMTN